MKKRILSLLLAAAMLIAVLPGMGFGAAAASKEEPKRVIGIVFDNSGSMYYDQTWCRATYAMEVFAAMMNDGDQMQVYPMYPIEIGKLSEAKDSVSIQIQKYPGWVILVFWILIALIIATIIWAFLNTKVLPKRIGTGKCTFSVDGSNVAGSPTCVFVGGGKKRGSLDISSPRYAANPSASCGFRLELEADSPRRTKSAARSVKVRNVTALNPSTTFQKINTFKMIQDPVTEKLVRAVGKADAPIEFTIKNNSSCTVTAEVLDVTSGGTTPVNLIVNLKFF